MKKERKKERKYKYFKNINLSCEEVLDTSFGDFKAWKLILGIPYINMI